MPAVVCPPWCAEEDHATDAAGTPDERAFHASETVELIPGITIRCMASSKFDGTRLRPGFYIDGDVEDLSLREIQQLGREMLTYAETAA